MNKKVNYVMIGKCLYFPKEKIVAIGDLHLGYEQMLHKEGFLFPMEQIKIVIEELKKIFNEILKNRKGKIEKILLLGDIQHSFNYEKEEKLEVFELFNFLRRYVKDKDIIIIKGNHDQIDIGKKFIEYYIEKGIAFSHGNKDFSELYEKDVVLVVIGHLHPSVMLKDEQGIKKEEYKCFLKGNLQGKEIISMPSFLSFVEGGKIEDYNENKSIISKKELEKFEVFVVNDNLDEEALSFGRLKDI